MDGDLPLADIEQAMKDTLHALCLDYNPEIATYGGEFTADEETFMQAVGRFPAIWITWEDARATQRNAVQSDEDIVFVVLMGARNVRNEESTRHGITNAAGAIYDVGTYQMLNHVRRALLGKDFGLCIEPLELGRAYTVFNTKLNGEAVSVLAQVFKTSQTTRVPDPEADAAGYIERINVDYIPKPNNNGIFAADTVELKEETP